MRYGKGLKATIITAIILSVAFCFFACTERPDIKGADVLPSDPVGEVVYTVTFDSVGGSGVASVSASVNAKIAEPAKPVRNGYAFDGWYTSENYFTKWDFGKDIVTSNVTLYARWRLQNDVFIDSAAFSFSPAGCVYSVSAATERVSLTDDIVLKQPNYRYAFFRDEECTDPVCDADKAEFTPDYGDNEYYLKISDSDMTAIAVIKFNVRRNRIFSVSFFDSEGALLGRKDCEEGTALDSPVDYSLTGYDVEWSDGTAKWAFGANGTTVKNDVALYAVPSVKYYTVTLDADGGEIQNAKIKVAFGENALFPAPSRYGFGFLGWFTADGTKITGSNGASISGWNVPDDVTLIAKWDSNAEDFILLRTLSGEVKNREQFIVAHGESAYLTASSVYSGIKENDGTYTLYVFGGWYSGDRLLSAERNYATEAVTGSTTVTEKWYEYTIVATDDYGADVDQKLSFTGSENLEKYGNVSVGETVAVTADCDCGKHTFDGWSTGERTATVYLGITAASVETGTLWKKFTVSAVVYLDGVTSENAVLSAALAGLGAARKGNTVTVSATPLAEYTFDGWYVGGTKESDGFGYGFVMEDSVTLQAKWLTTADLYKIVSEDEAKGKVSVKVRPENNFVGGYASLVPEIGKGYILDGLYGGEGDKVDSVESGALTRTIPAEPVVLTAKFKENNIAVTSNVFDAGSVAYKINDGRKHIGTTYGGAFEFDGMISGDTLRISAETYDGYVWLGWYKDDELITVGEEFTISSVDADEAEVGREYIACWKPAAYTVNVTAGVFAASSPTYITANKYYTYVDGLFVLCPAGAVETGVKYYTFAADTYTGGTQKVTAAPSDGKPGEDVSLTATVNDGYRFEGWYDDKNELITFDLVYTFNVNGLGREYKAWYTHLDDDYEISVAAYGGTSTEPAVAVANAGIGFYAYKRVSDGKAEEICVVTVKTKKEAVTKNAAGESEYRGFNYLGLYKGSQDMNWNSLTNPFTPTGGASGFNGKDFSYTYEINVTEIRYSGGEKQNLLAVWRKSSGTSIYYVTADIINADEGAGSVYYVAYNGSIILVAEPNNGYIFRGWYDASGAVASTETVYTTGGNGRGKTYTARWKTLNGTTDVHRITIKGAAESAEGGYVLNGTETAVGDSIRVEAYTNDGYAFLGWYNGGKLLTPSSGFELVRKIVSEDGAEKEVLVLYDERGNEICRPESDVFEPRWKKTDARVIVDSVGDATITGFSAEDESGLLRNYYRLKVSSEVEFGVRGAAWYEGWFFDGWYDADGTLLGTDYELIVPSGMLKMYYKAVWSKINLKVTINSNGEAMGGSTATYSYYLDGNNLYLVLNAAPASGYSFAGWDLEEDGTVTTLSRALQYSINLGVFDRDKITGDFVYNALFAEIAEQYKPVARTTDGSSLASPVIIGYRPATTEGTEYRVTARDINGYVFLGWQEKDAPGTDYFSTERTVTYTTQYTALAAVYALVTSLDGYYGFYVNAGEGYEDNVAYYAYYSGDEIVMEIAVALPAGFAYTVTDERGTRFGADPTNPYIVRIPDGAAVGGLTVGFSRISEINGYHTAVEQQLDNVVFGMNGKYEIRTGSADGRIYYEEVWQMNASFGDDDYSFIGWYDEDGTLLGIYDDYVTSAYGKDKAIITRFGKYQIHIVNTEEEAGRVYADGYDVTVSFDINTDDEALRAVFAAGVPSQELNAGDKITYPTQYADKPAAGYMFGGWYADPDCEGEQYDFDAAIKSDLILYARWISLADYNATQDDVLYADGNRQSLKVSLSAHDYYFTAVVTGEYLLKIKNTSEGQNTAVTYGEARVSGGLVNGNNASATSTEEKTISISVAAGRTYCVRLSSDSEADKTVLVQLTRPAIEANGRRDATIAYGGSVTVIAVPRGFTENVPSGYVFAGWKAADGTLVTAVREINMQDGVFSVYPETATISYEDYAAYANADGVIELTAYWKKYEIEIIHSDLDGGSAGVYMTTVEGDPAFVENAGARKWTLGAMAQNNYSFGGWYLYDTVNEKFEDEPFSLSESFDYYVYDGSESLIIKCEWIYNTESGKYTITYNLNMSDAVNSPYNVAGYNSQSTTTILLYNPHKYYKDSSGKTVGYYVFEGWYTDREFKNRITEINPLETKANVTVYAKWGDPVKNVDILTDADGSRYFYLGIYPQTRITSSAVISSLQIDSASYPQGDYRALYKYFTPSDGTRYMKVHDSLFYRCDPIRWDIRFDSDGTAYAQSSVVLDAMKFNLTTNNLSGTYANDWSASKLREWLANEFYAVHFTETEKNLLNKAALTVSNDESTGYTSYRDADRFPWAKQSDTTDVAFAPSYAEITDATAGFIDNASRIAEYSDYAADKFAVSGIKGYWLRSWGETASKAFAVGENGELVRLSVDSECGVRPIIRLNTYYCANER